MIYKTIIVAGMGRCGTSLMMQMLHRAGVQCIGTFPDFETHNTMFGRFDQSFLSSLQSIAIKIIDPAKLPIPVLHHHVVIWLDRSADQQAASCAKLLQHAEGLKVGRSARRGIERLLRKDRRFHRAAFGQTPMYDVSFEQLIDWPHKTSAAVSEWLAEHGWQLDSRVMADCVRPRSSDCYPGFLEVGLVNEVSR